MTTKNIALAVVAIAVIGGAAYVMMNQSAQNTAEMGATEQTAETYTLRLETRTPFYETSAADRVLGSFPANIDVTVDAEENNMVHASFNGLSGWISAPAAPAMAEEVAAEPAMETTEEAMPEMPMEEAAAAEVSPSAEASPSAEVSPTVAQ